MGLTFHAEFALFDADLCAGSTGHRTKGHGRHTYQGRGIDRGGVGMLEKWFTDKLTTKGAYLDDQCTDHPV